MFKRNEPGFLVMRAENNKYNGPEKRVFDRRVLVDRRATTRFSDVLGRRSGVERRLPISYHLPMR